jgi:hypothetical protein
MKTIFSALLAVATLFAAASAHHSFAMFDRTKSVTVTGVIKEFQFTNPHSWLQVNVTDAKGSVVEWSFEMEGPSTLLRAGIKKSSLLPGEKVTVTAWVMKDGRPGGAVLSIKKGDGTVLSPRPGGPPGPPTPADPAAKH